MTNNNPTPSELIDLVADMNDRLISEHQECPLLMFTYCTDGFTNSISFGSVVVWNDEDDYRDYLFDENGNSVIRDGEEQKEDLEYFILKSLRKSGIKVYI